ncbi:hypothetical protein [Amycolatopsis sp. PS_44_ISF1]|uniref:hypothetical protein n=1 Tax=Amycolatopsis sp. PS_44_ISF1 TaxID=2974917 RepID=UPI0028DE6938|nr:hypothetical protein [Amycolatopsis sp. PS_44_ISF1]MDT8914152.1 hypothetical protein [Amycolatopsis sp. PS_44_ISF1]
MRHLTKLVGTGLILLTVTACGGPETMATAPGAPSGTTATTPPSAPGKPQLHLPPGRTPVADGQVDGTALPQDFPRQVYTADGGRTITLRAEEGGCQHALGQAVEQTAQRVVLDLSETKAQTGQMCTMDLRYPYISVPLSAPLGGRAVVLKQSTPR